MSNWFSKNLGDGILALEPLRRIEEVFLSEYAKAGSPKEMAVFFRHESEGHLHCEVWVYISPASAMVAKAVGAKPCRKPLSTGLSLLAGAEKSWSTLFPEQDG